MGNEETSIKRKVQSIYLRTKVAGGPRWGPSFPENVSSFAEKIYLPSWVISHGCNYTYMELLGASLPKRKASCLKGCGCCAPAILTHDYGTIGLALLQERRVRRAISGSAPRSPCRKRAFMVGVLILELLIFFCAPEGF